MLRTMTASLILHERVETTIAKAKELRSAAEKLITHAKRGNYVEVRKRLQNKAAFKKLFDVIAQRYEGRPGGYTQIVRLGNRPGDNTQTGLIRLMQ